MEYIDMGHHITKYLRTSTGSRGKTGRLDTGKYLCPVLLLCFLGGIIIANFIDKGFMGGFGIFNTYFIEKFKYTDIQSDDLFFYIIKERLPVLTLLLLLGATNWGTIAGSVFLSWQGFAAGFLMAISVSAYGIKGIILMGTAVFPHYLVYIPVYICYMYFVSFFQKVMLEKGGWHSGKLKKIILFMAVCLLIISIFVTGIFLESYINPYLLKKILKIF